jgi:ABC-type multidrug transport system permease subunit
MAAMGSSIGLHSQFVVANGKTTGEDFSYQGTLFSTHSQGAATAHLLLSWFMLAAMIVILGLATAYFLKRKDVRR